MDKKVTRKEVSELVDRFGDMADQICKLKEDAIAIAADLADIVIRQKEDKKKEISKKPQIEFTGEFAGMKKSMDAFFDEVDRMIDEAKKKKKEVSKNDMVSHPKHYQGKMECIDAMEKEFGKTAVEWFCLLNAFKYEYRKDKKGFIKEDEKKRNWYITKFNELRSSQKKEPISTDRIVKLVNRYK